MKSNLDKYYKTNKQDETEGIWFLVGDEDGPGFRLKRFGGFNSPEMKKIMATKYKPYLRQVRQGTLPAEKEKQIMTEMFVEIALVDWKNIEINDKEVAFDKKIATEFLVGLPDLTDELIAYCSNKDNYREELGNS